MGAWATPRTRKPPATARSSRSPPRGCASREPSDGAWDLLDRLTKVYMSASNDFPAPRGPGYIVRYEIERIGGVGPWASR